MNENPSASSAEPASPSPERQTAITGHDRLTEEVEVAGHIIDSLLLPKILDTIIVLGGEFRIKKITVGQTPRDPSYALLNVMAPSTDRLAQILAAISSHGATPLNTRDCALAPADIAGAFPEAFYSSTNQPTQVRIHGLWIDVERQEMDCGIAVDTHTPRAWCVPMTDTTLGMPLVIGHAGVRILPVPRSAVGHGFEFMNSPVSTEKPKGVAIRQVALELFRNKRQGGKTLVVGGPAIVHTGSGKHFCELIERGYVQVLFAGNALATHDIEQAMFDTSLGVDMRHGQIVDAGHEHHLRAINRVRRFGGIRQTIAAKALTQGIMFHCFQHGVDVLLAGSIRDDGPLPEVITDSIDAQRQMRARLPGVTFCLMIATTLHSIAVGNLLPSSVKVVCVDINPSTVIKLNDRGSFQTVGLVTDVEPFLRSLVAELRLIERDEA